MKVIPTIKQKQAYKGVVENHWSISKSMREAGYTKATAVNPKNLTETEGWKMLLKKYLPENELLAVHQKALHATKLQMSYTGPDMVVEDIPTQLKAVELGYKVTGKLKESSINISGDKVIAILGNTKSD